MRMSTKIKAITLAASIGSPALAVTLHKPETKPFLYDITTFTTTIALPLEEKHEKVRIPLSKLKTRVKKSEEDKTIEPLSVALGPEERQIVALSERIARVGKEDDLIRYLANTYDKSDPIKKGSPNRMVVIDKEGYQLVNPHALSDLYAKTHRKLTLDIDKLNETPRMRRKLMSQIKPFVSSEHFKRLQAQMKQGGKIEIDAELLPEFARKMVGSYLIYRGPNCFHAALAFQSTKLTSSSLFNVKEEKEYHRSMINYDELWRTLNTNFYEVNPDKTPLKYGDVLIFFDVPPDFQDADRIHFKWIRHAATYLFNHYTFSKGSKSPNSPYTIRTVSDEWNTWKKFTKNLGVKVFRRNQKRVTNRPPKDLVDWIY